MSVSTLFPWRGLSSSRCPSAAFNNVEPCTHADMDGTLSADDREDIKATNSQDALLSRQDGAHLKVSARLWWGHDDAALAPELLGLNMQSIVCDSLAGTAEPRPSPPKETMQPSIGVQRTSRCRPRRGRLVYGLYLEVNPSGGTKADACV